MTIIAPHTRAPAQPPVIVDRRAEALARAALRDFLSTPEDRPERAMYRRIAKTYVLAALGVPTEQWEARL